MTAGILVTPPAGFEVSTNNTAFSGSLTVGAAGTIASTKVYVRLAPANPAGTYSGNVILSSQGAASVFAPTTSGTGGGKAAPSPSQLITKPAATGRQSHH